MFVKKNVCLAILFCMRNVKPFVGFIKPGFIAICDEVLLNDDLC